MSLRLQFTTGSLLLLFGIALMTYAYTVLHESPYVCAAVMLWLCLVEYAVGRAWWVDAQELVAVRRSRREL